MRETELEDTKAAFSAPYMAVRTEVLKLSADPRTKSEASALLHEQLEPTYEKLQGAIDAEVNFNKTSSEDAGRQIQEAVSRAQNGMLLGLLIGVILSLGAGYVLVKAIDGPLARLVAAMEPMRGGDFSQKVSLVSDGEFSILADGLNLVTNSLQEMIRRVQKSGLQVNTSATEIAATAQEQLSTASEVAATTSEIGATSREISTTSKELVLTIKEIAGVAEKTALLAGQWLAGGLSRIEDRFPMQQVAEASRPLSMPGSES